MDHADGLNLTWAKEVMLANSPRDGLRLSVWRSAPGTGTPLLWRCHEGVVWGYLGAHHPRTVSQDALSPEWVRRVFHEPCLLKELPGVFAFVAANRERRACAG